MHNTAQHNNLAQARVKTPNYFQSYTFPITQIYRRLVIQGYCNPLNNNKTLKMQQLIGKKQYNKKNVNFMVSPLLVFYLTHHSRYHYHSRYLLDEVLNKSKKESGVSQSDTRPSSNSSSLFKSRGVTDNSSPESSSSKSSSSDSSSHTPHPGLENYC